MAYALPTSPDLIEPEARDKYVSELDMTSRFMYRWFEVADFDGPLIRRLVELLREKKIAVNLTLFVNEIVYNTDDLSRVVPESQAPNAVVDQGSVRVFGWSRSGPIRALP